jgi:hypothetical protein
MHLRFLEGPIQRPDASNVEEFIIDSVYSFFTHIILWIPVQTICGLLYYLRLRTRRVYHKLGYR